MIVGVSVIGVSVGRGSSVDVDVGKSVGVIVAVGVSGTGVSLGRNVDVTNDGGVDVGCTSGSMVGIRPMQAAKITPIDPIIATNIKVFVSEFLSVINNS